LPKKTVVLASALVLLFCFVTACGKSKEQEKKMQEAREWELQNFSEGPTPKPKAKPLPKDLKIVVPESVKAKYHSVVLGVGDLKTKEIKEFTVKIGGEAKAPGTDFTVKVEAYLPEWKLEGNTVTSKSDNPADPAVRATIYEGGKVVFDGFIIQRAKSASFSTDKVVIGLMKAK